MPGPLALAAILGSVSQSWPAATMQLVPSGMVTMMVQVPPSVEVKT